MHSKTEGTSLLWRSIVDFLFEKGISIPRITTKIQTPCNTNFLWMKNSTPFQTIIFDSVFYFISILSFVILFYKVLSQNIWPFFRFMLFCPKTTSLSEMGQRWHCKMEGEGAMCMKLYQPSELTTKDKNVWCSLTTELFNDVNSPRVLTFYGEHFSHFENFD